MRRNDVYMPKQKGDQMMTLTNTFHDNEIAIRKTEGENMAHRIIENEDGSRTLFCGDLLTWSGTWHEIAGHLPAEIAAIETAMAPVPLSEAALELLREKSPVQLEAMRAALDPACLRAMRKERETI